MQSKKMLFIVNPRSGRAAIRAHLLDAISIFTEAGYLVTCYITQHAGEVTDVVRNLGPDFERIVVSGGDGTINEAVNGLVTLPRQIPLGILPAGTTNDYAYTLSLPAQVPEAAAIAAQGRLYPIDLGSFNGRYFTYVAAFGLFTEVPYETPQDMKNLLGGVAYGLEGARRLLDIKSHHVRLEYDGGVIEDDFILALFTNTLSVAGLHSAFDGAELDDGLLEVTLVRTPRTLADISTIINLLLDIESMRGAQSDFLTHVCTTRVTVEADEPLSWTLDGEKGGAHARAVIENHHLAAVVVTGEESD